MTWQQSALLGTFRDGLVHDQNLEPRARAQQHARDRQQLPLAVAELARAVAEPADRAVEPHAAQRRDQRRVVDFPEGVEVVPHGAREEQRRLRHDRERAAERLQPEAVV